MRGVPCTPHVPRADRQSRPLDCLSERKRQLSRSRRDFSLSTPRGSQCRVGIRRPDCRATVVVFEDRARCAGPVRNNCATVPRQPTVVWVGSFVPQQSRASCPGGGASPSPPPPADRGPVPRPLSGLTVSVPWQSQRATGRKLPAKRRLLVRLEASGQTRGFK